MNLIVECQTCRRVVGVVGCDSVAVAVKEVVVVGEVVVPVGGEHFHLFQARHWLIQGHFSWTQFQGDEFLKKFTSGFLALNFAFTHELGEI